MSWTVTQFLSDLKVRLQVPDSNGAFTDAEFLKVADQVLWLEMEPLLQSLRNDYYVETNDQTMVVGTAAYRITHRAVGSKLRDVMAVDSGGNEVTLAEIAPEDAWRYAAGSSGYWGAGAAYYFRGEHVVILPTPTVAQTLRMRYYLRRPRLDNGTFTTTVSALSSSTQITVTAATSGMVLNGIIDIIRAKPYFDHLAIDTTITAASGNLLTIGTYDSGIAVGDIVAESGYTSVIPLPAEMYPLLLNGTVIRVMQSRGDPAWQAELATYERDKRSVVDMFSTRNDGESQRIINRSSPLRAGKFR